MTLSLPAIWFAGSSGDDSDSGNYSRRDHSGRQSDHKGNAAIDPRLGIANSEITGRIREGDAILFGQLFDTYWPQLVRFANLYTRGNDEAEDVAAQVFAALWEKHSEWHLAGSIEAYLYSAVRNRAHNVHRAAKRFERNATLLAGAGESPTAGAPQLRADLSVLADERRERLLAAVNSLPDRPREVLLLRWLRDMEFSEIATLMSISKNTVHVAYHRAIGQLRERIPEYFE